MFSGGIERDQWHKMGNLLEICFNLKFLKSQKEESSVCIHRLVTFTKYQRDLGLKKQESLLIENHKGNQNHLENILMFEKIMQSYYMYVSFFRTTTFRKHLAKVAVTIKFFFVMAIKSIINMINSAKILRKVLQTFISTYFLVNVPTFYPLKKPENTRKLLVFG